MCSYFRLRFSILSIFYYFRVVKSVVPEYCLGQFNRSDCGGKPVEVMTYYKPGSRCEVDVWRGCPTVNKFSNEFECANVCLFKFDNRIEDTPDECELKLNDNHCEDIEVLVYTYENGDCIAKIWRGCPSPNKFATQKACEKTCIKDWEEHLEDLSAEELNDVDEVINEIIDEITTTEAELSIESEEVTESPTTTEEVEEETEVTEEATTTPEPQASESEEEVIITK